MGRITDLVIGYHDGAYFNGIETGWDTYDEPVGGQDVLDVLTDIIDNLKAWTEIYEKRAETIRKYGDKRVLEAMSILRYFPDRANDIDRSIAKPWQTTAYDKEE